MLTDALSRTTPDPVPQCDVRPAKDCLEDFDTLDLEAETEALFLYKNAEHVFALQG